MGQSTQFGTGLSGPQFEKIKLTLAGACRKMTSDQVLDLADHLHDLIRRRSYLTASRFDDHGLHLFMERSHGPC